MKITKVKGLTTKMKNFIIFILLFVSLGVAEQPLKSHVGLWEQEYINKNFYTVVYFHADLNHWQFEHISYFVDSKGEITKHVVAEKYMSGEYRRLKRKLNNIVICKTNKFLVNNINIVIKKEIFYALRMISDTTASFGLLKGNDIHEAYKFKKKREWE